MAKFIAFDDGNTVINIDHISMIRDIGEYDKTGTRIYLGESDAEIIVAEDFAEVVKAVKALSRK